MKCSTSAPRAIPVASKRRLNLAIGLLHAPQILYLDEPTVGIDARSRQVILAAIKALRDSGTTLVYTSHYMEEIEAICDQLAVIDHGRVVKRGSTAELVGDVDAAEQPGMGRLERALPQVAGRSPGMKQG